MNTGPYKTATCSTGEQESAGTGKEGQTRSMLWKMFPEARSNKTALEAQTCEFLWFSFSRV